MELVPRPRAVRWRLNLRIQDRNAETVQEFGGASIVPFYATHTLGPGARATSSVN